jgi:hypothetical protein
MGENVLKVVDSVVSPSGTFGNVQKDFTSTGEMDNLTDHDIDADLLPAPRAPRGRRRYDRPVRPRPPRRGTGPGRRPARRAARTALKPLKPLKLDPVRQARGRGQAIAIIPEQIRQMNTADPTMPHKAGSRRRRRDYALPELTVLRYRALHTLAFGISGRSQEVSALDDTAITLVAEGLEVHVPSVKGRPARDAVVAYREHIDSCPVRCWLAWKEAAGLDGGPAFRPIDQWGNLSGHRLSPDGCRQAQTRAAERVGLTARITGHSYRAGLITTGRKKGKRAEKLRAQSSHAESSPSATARSGRTPPPTASACRPERASPEARGQLRPRRGGHERPGQHRSPLPRSKTQQPFMKIGRPRAPRAARLRGLDPYPDHEEDTFLFADSLRPSATARSVGWRASARPTELTPSLDYSTSVRPCWRI